MASGSLGQGLSVAIGSAETKKLNNDKKIIYTLHGDGELQEGQIWEAAMYASANKIDNLIATIDYNLKQIDGSTDDVLNLGDLKKKFEAFDWIVLENKEGNNIKKVISYLETPILLHFITFFCAMATFLANNHKSLYDLEFKSKI